MKNFSKELNRLKECTTYSIRKKMISANITCSMIIDAYNENRFTGLVNLLGSYENGIIKVTKKVKVIQKIVDFLEKSANNSTKK